MDTSMTTGVADLNSAKPAISPISPPSQSPSHGASSLVLSLQSMPTHFFSQGEVEKFVRVSMLWKC